MRKPYLPPEILDSIVDLLRDNPKALKKCCLVSKSWIPRIRKHLFAHVPFITSDNLKSWKRTFPDPSTSPAHHAKALTVGCPHIVTATDAEVGGWIRGFSCAVGLKLVEDQRMYVGKPEVSFLPFHAFSSVVKSLHVYFIVLSSSRIFDLILSFPLLEDLVVVVYDTLIDSDDGSNQLPTITQPLNSPVFTGSLELFSSGGMEHIACRLLSLPGGIRFRKLTLTWFHERDLYLTMALVEGCSYALESIDVTCYPYVESGPASIDLTKATKLKNAVFRARSLSVDWITAALRTITPKHRDLGRISIHVYFDSTHTSAAGANISQVVGDQIFGQWLELDQFLTRLWESHSIRPRIMHHTSLSKGNEWARGCMGCLLPEMMGRGIVDLAERMW